MCSTFDDFPPIFPSSSLLLSSSRFPSLTSLPINVSSTSTHYTIRTELPGIPQNQISVNISEDGVLTIQAERYSKDEKENKDEGENELIKENFVTKGKLHRSIKFPKDDIDTDNIRAELNNGELIIKVTKKKAHDEKEKKKTIKIFKGKL